MPKGVLVGCGAAVDGEAHAAVGLGQVVGVDRDPLERACTSAAEMEAVPPDLVRAEARQLLDAVESFHNGLIPREGGSFEPACCVHDP
ncbi:hypothetical protein [Antribacter gilvus]|uniref:hypothetical protein n=1 Tax=Antribacter gilvus TaxID=2304675 RepID=UPI000F76B1D9|nr:hypothetical protein [Antribacter gilvus]